MSVEAPRIDTEPLPAAPLCDDAGISGRAPHDYLAQVHSGAAQRGLVRPRRGRLVAGVLAGLANRLGISPTAARVLFLLSLLLPGPQIVGYIVLWVLIPKER